ncbi:hypothetical protein HCN44_009645 [Aphidius gifuensis]|uniref:cysteine--tRNA ligase n=1 Tax=Aphidius gifuensis TaxID=684658 RepID=A0A834Y5H7_APHGI|nr:probable cysteine--tRNA ligase, mitochondrial [Aphidius gifuensis]KAF7998247.1 hypothetical protein HCN44_009645 [Aphidius gifuensis]
MRIKFGFTIWKRYLHHSSPQKLNNWKKPVGFDTGISIYNYMIKKKVPLILNNKNIAKWYMCGPTVYDSAHIGHACTYTRFDIIRRILSEHFNINVICVMSITDIDDKIINRSSGSSQFSDWKELSKYYENEFNNDMKLLNIQSPYLNCRVTDYIPQIIDFINVLLEKNMAYVVNGSVYFKTLDCNLYDKFGKLDKKAINMDNPSERGEKKSSLDFALWKASKTIDEPSWKSPWGNGRPGWHIECSAMASFTLGSNIDIHSGGIDLMFPHHENEEAQSCCYHSTGQWINNWLHSGLLHLDDTKMSKSLNNTVTIRNMLDKYTPNQFRLLCLYTHYRSTIEFNEKTMDKAVALMKKFEYFYGDCKNYISGKLQANNIDEALIYDRLINAQVNIKNYLANDFGTPQVIEELSELVTVVNKMIVPSDPDSNNTTTGARSADCIAAVSQYVDKVLKSFGIVNSQEVILANDDKINQIVDTLVNFRSTIRNKALKDFKDQQQKELLTICDDARKNLSDCGIKIKDFKDNSTWTILEK